ncbi:MAG: DUF86 domain-containing protein [Sulfurimonas sp.]|uniref:HepT-like ribonuclease domain-containing protein n=1 Tax=Sulfurimonas sp. TaxID=2022749 RepID=UPI003D0C7C23
MYSSKNITYILTILEAIEKIFYYSNNFEDEEEFFHANKQLNFNATVNLLIAIGEENKKIDDALKSTDDISWKNISAMRDKIAHNYRGIDESMVWDIVQNYLPTLKKLLIEMLPKIQNSQIYIEEALKSEYYEDLVYLKL